MKIRFWGVRGSIPVPGTETQHYGGNTSCVEITDGDHSIILDAGTGLREMGRKLKGDTRREFHILLSHCHFDHLSGLPFFRALHEKNKTVHVYGPRGEKRSLRRSLEALFSEEFFPVPFSKIPAEFHCHTLGVKKIQIDSFHIQPFVVNHPGKALAYAISNENARIVYMTDHEPIKRFRHLSNVQPEQYDQELHQYLKGADLLIHDGQYTDEVYSHFKGWGHSPWSYAIRLADRVGIKRLVLYHHDPDSDDAFLRFALKTLRYTIKEKRSRLDISLAREGVVIRP